MLNRAILIGNVGRDPEIRTTQGGTRIANFSIATSESWKDRHTGEKKEKTEWHNVVCFNEHLVKVIEDYVKKGSKLYIEGKIRTRKWEKDGVDRYSTEVVMENFDGKLILLGESKGGGGRAPAAESQDDYGSTSSRDRSSPATRNTSADLDDEIPF